MVRGARLGPTGANVLAIQAINRKRFLSGLLAASSALALSVALPGLSHAQPVPAGCTPSPAVNGATINCVAPPDPIDPIATTVDDLTINVGTDAIPTNVTAGAGVDGIRMTGAGTQTLNVSNGASVVTGGNYGINLTLPIGATGLNITSAGTAAGTRFGIFALSAGTGDLTINANTALGTTNNGIYATSSPLAGNLAITATGLVSGGQTGISAINYGNGALTLNTATTSGGTAYGMYVYNSANGTGLSITATGQTTGGNFGLIGVQLGSGDMSISTAGVEGTTGTGIFAYNLPGSGALSISSTGAVQGGTFGISAQNRGSGALSINTSSVAGTNVVGILAINDVTAADLTIAPSGPVTGNFDGINVRNFGTGSLSIDSSDVTGENTTGIFAYNSVNGTGLSITSTGPVAGGIEGIQVGQFGSGSLSINVADVTGNTDDGLDAGNFGPNSMSIQTSGNVTGADDGIDAYNSALGTTLSITSTGPIVGGHQGIDAVNLGSGGLTISAVDITGNGDDAIDTLNINGGAQTIETTGMLIAVDDGIDATNATTATDLSITMSGSITAGQSGIEAYQYGTGTSSVMIRGSVVGQTEQGVYSVSATGATITVTQSGNVTGAQNGLLLDSAPGTITNVNNQGTITGTIGINSSISQGSAHVITSGQITGTGGTAISFGKGDDTLTVLTGAGFGSTIAFGTGANSLNVCADNAVAFDVTVDPGGTLSFLDCSSQGTVGFNGSMVASVNPNDGFSQIIDTFIDVSGSIQGTLELETGGLGLALASARKSLPYQVASSSAIAPGYSRSEQGAWLRGLGGYMDRDREGSEEGSKHRFFGGLGGFDVHQEDNLSVGLFGGYTSSDLDTDDNVLNLDSDRYLGGAYFATAIGAWALNASAIAGYGFHDQDRIASAVNDRARASYNSTFVSGGVATERTFGETLNDLGLRPSFGVLYSGEFMNSYTETGVAAPLTMMNRSVEGITGFAELALVTVMSLSEQDLIGFELRAGAEGRHMISGDTVNATLLGTSLSFEPVGDDNSVDGYVGIGVEGTIRNTIALFADVEGRSGTETNHAVRGQAGIKWLF